MRTFTTLPALLLASAALALPALAAAPATTTTPSTTTPTTASPSSPTPTPRSHAHWFAGAVSSVGSSSLGIDVLWTGPHDGSLDGQTVTVAVDSGTQITGRGGSPDSLANIQAGDLVGIAATGVGSDLSSLTATHVHAYCNCHWVGGTLAQIGSSSITVQVKRTGPYDGVLAGQSVTIALGGSTVYVRGKDKTPIGLGDLQTGEGVGVVFSANGFFRAPGFNPETATFTASQVHAWARRQVPNASTDVSKEAQTTA